MSSLLTKFIIIDKNGNLYRKEISILPNKRMEKSSNIKKIYSLGFMKRVWDYSDDEYNKLPLWEEDIILY